MVGAALRDAGTTILILPTVALRGDILVRLGRAGVRYLVWSPASTQSAPLVIVSADAACTQGFLAYACRLADRQTLDRIVVDECHLTVTAGDYRPCILQLGWYVRQIRTQTVWLTATLPPSMQVSFFEQNKLVRPHVVRESTNRPNIRYLVRRDEGGQGQGTQAERAAQFVRRLYRKRKEVLRDGRAKMILYCQTKALAAELAGALECPSYTSESGTEAEKEAIIRQWLATSSLPAIVATSALGVGFDYPYVRWVIHVGAPTG